MAELRRREVLKAFALAGGATAAGTAIWWKGTDLASAVQAGVGPYGDLLAADANGIQLPPGFTSRVVATTGQRVGASNYTWHGAPDGGSCFGRGNGGWVYVSNSELDVGTGGAGAISFNADGSIANSYRILSGTTRNCAGGATPWSTWLSCEENGGSGQVYECNPYGGAAGVVRPALGRFNHEAAAVEPSSGIVYMTEDHVNGRLYRFVPQTRGDLVNGQLQAAVVTGANVTWVPASTTAPDRQATTTIFNGAEGAWIHKKVLYFCTKGDHRVWALDLVTQTISVFYDRAATPGAALSGVDNICAHVPSNDLFVAEDGGNMEICILGVVDGVLTVAPFLRVVGHGSSELCGPAFNPAGNRLYFSSQRGADGVTGVTYEISGPFRTAPVAVVDAEAPTVPAGVAASVAGSDVTVSWEASTDLPNPGGVGVAAYFVVRDWTTQWRVPANGPLSYTDVGVAAGNHRYQVFAVDAGSRLSAGSTPVTVAVGAPPPVDTQAPTAPGAVVAVQEGAGVRVTWDPATDLPDPGGVGVAAYFVVRDWTTQWRVPAGGALEFVDPSPPLGRRRYEVRAVDRGNRIGPASAPAIVTVV